MAHAFHINQDSTSPIAQATKRSWIVVLVASLFFFYEFIQMNMFNSISVSLMHAFHIDAGRLGDLSSFYFIANVVFLFFAGILLDRCSTRRVILSALAICILGTLMFSFATSFDWACFFRFLTGIGSAFCFLSVIRLASRWFPSHQMALVLGIVLTIAMLGGFVSQTPMELLAHTFHWRTALQIDAAFGVLIFLLIFTTVHDYPDDHVSIHLSEQAMIQEIGYFQSMRMAFLRLQNWLGGLYVCFVNLPVGLLGGLWGVLYLTGTHDISRVNASEISSMLFMGTMLGAPLSGWISDKMGLRKPLMLLGAVISFALVILVMVAHHLSFYAWIILFVSIGLFTSTQIIAYPLIVENSKRMITAMSVSVINISVQAGSGLFQPFFGYLLDKHMFMRVHQITTHFSASDFSWAMWIFPIGFVLAAMLVFVLPETHCRQKD